MSGRGGIDAKKTRSGLPSARTFEFRAEFVFGNDFGGALSQGGELVVN